MTTCPPWLGTVNKAPWNTSQPIYSRLITVSRNKSVAGVNDSVGNTGYSGFEQGVGVEGETILYSNLPCVIQLGSSGSRSRTSKGGGELPGDAVTKPIWTIFIPANSISIYSIRDRDILTDDEGYRYEVAANQWLNLGYQLSVIREEA